MSTRTAPSAPAWLAGSDRRFQRPGLLGVGLLIGSFTSVFYHVSDVVGSSLPLLALVAAMVGLATVLGRRAPPSLGVGLAVLIGAVGLGGYFLSIPESNRALFTAGRVASDVLALLTGLSVLRLTNAGVWTLAVTPGPVFLTWYLGMRRRYVGAVTVGGATLAFLVLTSDAGALVTLAGVVGATAAVGLGTLELRGGLSAQWDTLAVIVATMIVTAALLSVVPGGAAQPLLPDRGSPTLEASLVASSDEVNVVGSIRLSPEVRYTVETDDPGYMQTGTYDRYTGGGWVRTGDTEPYDGRQSGPPGSSTTVRQEVTARTSLGVLPARWKPVSLEGDLTQSARVTSQGTLRPGRTVQENESFTIVSEVPRYTESLLRRSGGDYPASIESTYTSLPDSTPQRVYDRAAAVAGDAENPYDTAVAIEQYLEANKDYSLRIERPGGSIADAFLFEMDAGYCTYFATTMVVMLRAQGVPARFVTGYTTGERIGSDEYAVRGLNAHAWVEVYFEDVGWVSFDPTPATARRTAERARLTEARQSGESGVDVSGSGPESFTPTPSTPEPVTTTPGNATTPNFTGTPDGGRALGGGQTPDPNELGPGATVSADVGGGGGGLPDLPDRRTIGIGLVALVGVAAGVRRTGLGERAYRAVWLRYQATTGEPVPDAVRAYQRLEYLLAREYRPRRPGETPRAYVESLARLGADERIREVGRIHERARYGDGVDSEHAATAVRLVDALTRERTPVVGRFWR